MEGHWTSRHITEHIKKVYTAWDETGANEVGTFDTYEEAKQALIEYAKTLNPKEES